MESRLFIELIVMLLLLSYSAIVPILFQILALAYTSVLHVYLYEEEGVVAQLTIDFLPKTILIVFASLIVQVAISWIGFKFIAVEVQCESNE